MTKKSLNIISAVCMGLIFAIALVSAILTSIATGYFLPADIVFLFTALLSTVMFLWALRVPMHSKAAIYIANLGLVVTSILFGTSYLTGTGLSPYYLSSSILNFVAAFFFFDALILTTHHLLHIYNFKMVAIVLFVAAGLVLVALAITRLVMESGDMGLGLIASTVSLIASAIVVPGLAIINLSSEGK